MLKRGRKNTLINSPIVPYSFIHPWVTSLNQLVLRLLAMDASCTVNRYLLDRNLKTFFNNDKWSYKKGVDDRICYSSSAFFKKCNGSMMARHFIHLPVCRHSVETLKTSMLKYFSYPPCIEQNSDWSISRILEKKIHNFFGTLEPIWKWYKMTARFTVAENWGKFIN